MTRPRVCIAHQTIMVGDAIGKDIAGAYRLLERCGYEVTLLCEYAHPEVSASFTVIATPELAEHAGLFDLLLYHHSIFWPAGEMLLRKFARAIVVKYHNITPAEFFEPYSLRYRDICTLGREQSERMAAIPNIVRWQCDSRFNADEIRALGVPDARCSVAPPFNSIDAAFGQVHAARYAPYVQLAVRADAKQLVDVYVRFYPLFQEAYAELGIPGAYFNDRLVEVIDHLLATPDVDGPLRVVRPHVFYQYADPELEALSAGQKTLLRMGKANAAQIKDKLRALRGALTNEPPPAGES